MEGSLSCRLRRAALSKLLALASIDSRVSFGFRTWRLGPLMRRSLSVAMASDRHRHAQSQAKLRKCRR